MYNRQGVEEALKELGTQIKGDKKSKEERRIVLIGAILIALKNERYREVVSEYENRIVGKQSIQELIRETVGAVGLEIDKVYEYDTNTAMALKKYYKRNLEGSQGIKFKKINEITENPIYVLVREIEVQKENLTDTEIYIQEILENDQRAKHGSKSVTSLLSILLNLPEVEQDQATLLVSDDMQEGVKYITETLRIFKENLNKLGIIDYQKIQRGEYTEGYTNGIIILEEKTREVQKRIKERKQSYSRVILELVTEFADILPKGGKCIAAVPITTLSSGLPIKENILKNHTLESVISVRLAGDLGYKRPMSILVITANLPQKENHETYFSYWGLKDEEVYNISVLERWINKYRERKEEKGFSRYKSVTSNDEWCAEQYIEMDYGYKGTEYRKIKELFKIEVLDSDIKTRGIKIEEEPTKGGIMVIGIKDENNGIVGYYMGDDGEKNITEGGCVILNQKTAFYQETEFISNAKNIRLEPIKNMTKEEMEFYAKALKQDVKRYDYRRTATISRVQDVRLPLYVTKRGTENTPDDIGEQEVEIAGEQETEQGWGYRTREDRLIEQLHTKYKVKEFEKATLEKDIAVKKEILNLERARIHLKEVELCVAKEMLESKVFGLECLELEIKGAEIDKLVGERTLKGWG